MNKTIGKITATGLQQLDDLLGGGLLPGEIFLLGGRPGSGKTTLAVKMALRSAAAHKTRVLFYSLEMKICDIARKMDDISDKQEHEYLCLPDDSHPRKGTDNSPARRVAKDVLIIDNPGVSINMLKKISEEMEAELLVIDYLQLMNDGEKKRSFPYDAVMLEIKELSGALEIPVIILVQTGRSYSSIASPFKKCEKYSDVIGYIQDVGTFKKKIRSMSIMKNRRGDFKNIRIPKFNRTGTRYIDFGTLGLKIGDEICFKPTGEIFHVGSGNGTPGNGGTLIRLPRPEPRSGGSLFSIRALTRLLRDGNLPYELDVYDLWTYKGKTFREIYEGIEKIEQIVKNRQRRNQ